MPQGDITKSPGHISQRVSFGAHGQPTELVDSNIEHAKKRVLDSQRQSAIPDSSIKRQRSLGSFIMTDGFGDARARRTSNVQQSLSLIQGEQNEIRTTAQVVGCALLSCQIQHTF